MGDAAFWAEQEYWEMEGLFAERQAQLESLPAYHWLTKEGDVLDMHNMTTTHLMNCIRFASPEKQKEIDTVLQQRAAP